MPKRNPEILRKRNDAIVKRYNKLSNYTRNGTEVYNNEYILFMLSKEFFYEADYIAKIIATHKNENEKR